MCSPENRETADGSRWEGGNGAGSNEVEGRGEEWVKEPCVENTSGGLTVPGLEEGKRAGEVEVQVEVGGNGSGRRETLCDEPREDV